MASKGIVVPAQLWLPNAIVYDSFTRADGVLGVTDGLGPEPGGAGLAWQYDAGVFVISANKAVGTPTAGADIITNGAFVDATGWEKTGGGAITVVAGEAVLNPTNGVSAIQTGDATSLGAWYLSQIDMYSAASTIGTFNTATNNWEADTITYYSITPSGVKTTYQRIFRAIVARTAIFYKETSGSGNDLMIDNVSLKPLTLSSLFATCAVGTSNVKVRAKVNANPSGVQGGLVARLDSAGTPANFVILYFDGAGNAKLDECVAGTYTSLLSAVKAFTSGDTLELDLSSTAWRAYHVTSAGVAVLLGSGTTNVTTGNLCGIFATDASVKFSSCEVWPKGNEGQFSVLDVLGI